MSESVNLPALGESVTEGTVTRWLKSVGDTVEVDEPLLEVSTDKVDTEIPSPIAGVIEEILVQEDETVDVGTALVRIGDGSGAGGDGAAPALPEQEANNTAQATETVAEEQAAPQPAPTQEAPAPQAPAPVPAQQAPAAQAQPEPQPTPEQPAAEPSLAQDAVPSPEVEPGQEERSDRGQTPPVPAPAPETLTDSAPPQPEPDHLAVSPAEAATPAPEPAAESAESAPGYITPIVRKLANERGVDLASLTGTGVGGRIRKEDVLAAAERKAAAPAPAAAPAAAAPAQPAQVEISPLRGTTVKMSRLRKVVAERAVVSMQSTAQLTTVVEVDVTKLAQLRDRVKGQFLEKTGTKLSFLPFFAVAAAEALRTYPIINAQVEGDTIVYPDTENISIAVDTERGLLTPVVRNAGDLNVAQLAQQIADLAGRTRSNKLKPDELAGGTFTVTNTGSRGALFDTPLVFLPQVAILGTGIVVKRPVVVSDGVSEAIAIRSMVYLALSYDHRIVDGADAARFLVQVKTRLEQGAFEGQLGI
ncbi:2-oxoglutarate dehydrogenase, E2 component, dihydrolipoamide succinyltransferase [Naasia sp. SYSU D00948]|uniref:2-oxoglutarate dehydrogenase, E2 component, dihydrolipoamide succinyltransferase n=1 Tax=Naasia sp. SYSU D00948 TaxID=2817379 RepID=UPI001B305651|nr:2-oxoglutarate dehydrogenase, E2 component, dihydrolipoamide succinyltransferase [Naasia sp. SYSU D00948]